LSEASLGIFPRHARSSLDLALDGYLLGLQSGLSDGQLNSRPARYVRHPEALRLLAIALYWRGAHLLQRGTDGGIERREDLARPPAVHDAGDDQNMVSGDLDQGRAVRIEPIDVLGKQVASLDDGVVISTSDS
jgi:hypothetical protein